MPKYSKKPIKADPENFFSVTDKVELGANRDKGLNLITGKELTGPDAIDPNIIEATDENFDNIINNKDLPVMVNFYDPG